MRLLGLILLIFLVVLAGFLLVGDYWLFDPAETQKLFDEYKPWAVPIGTGLMMLDLLLPVPSSGIMAWYGNAYSVWLGGLAGTVACMASSLVAYGLCRGLGQRAAERIAGAEDLERSRGFFARWGGLAVAAVRPVPMLAEAVYCLAGLSRMPFGRFALSSGIGSAVFAFAFAWLGEQGKRNEEPMTYLGISLVVPMLLWIPVALAFRRRRKPTERRTEA